MVVFNDNLAREIAGHTDSLYVADTTKFLTLFQQEATASQPTTNTASRVRPKLTEEFLMSLEGVADASVWLEDEGLRAHVTLFDEITWSERALKATCLAELGIHQTPKNVLILLAGTPPTHAAIHISRPVTQDHVPGLAA